MIESYVVECFFRPHDTCSDPTVDELVVRAYADSEMELVRRFTNDVFGGGGSASGSTVQLPPKSTGAAHARLSGRSSRGGFATPSRRPSLDGGQAEQQRALSADFQRALSLQPPVAGAHGASVSTTSVPTTSHRSDFTIGQLVKIKVYQSVTSAPSYDGNGSAADTVHYYKVPVHVSLRSLTRKLREYLPQPFDALEYRDPRDGRRYAMTMDRELREAMQVCAGQPLVLFAV